MIYFFVSVPKTIVCHVSYICHICVFAQRYPIVLYPPLGGMLGVGGGIGLTPVPITSSVNNINSHPPNSMTPTSVAPPPASNSNSFPPPHSIAQHHNHLTNNQMHNLHQQQFIDHHHQQHYPLPHHHPPPPGMMHHLHQHHSNSSASSLNLSLSSSQESLTNAHDSNAHMNSNMNGKEIRNPTKSDLNCSIKWNGE